MNKRFTRKYIVHLVKNCRPWDRKLGDTISVYGVIICKYIYHYVSRSHHCNTFMYIHSSVYTSSIILRLTEGWTSLEEEEEDEEEKDINKNGFDRFNIFFLTNLILRLHNDYFSTCLETNWAISTPKSFTICIRWQRKQKLLPGNYCVYRRTTTDRHIKFDNTQAHRGMNFIGRRRRRRRRKRYSVSKLSIPWSAILDQVNDVFSCKPLVHVLCLIMSPFQRSGEGGILFFDAVFFLIFISCICLYGTELFSSFHLSSWSLAYCCTA
jgi:hypothetical protein